MTRHGALGTRDPTDTPFWDCPHGDGTGRVILATSWSGDRREAPSIHAGIDVHSLSPRLPVLLNGSRVPVRGVVVRTPVRNRSPYDGQSTVVSVLPCLESHTGSHESWSTRRGTATEGCPPRRHTTSVGLLPQSRTSQVSPSAPGSFPPVPGLGRGPHLQSDVCDDRDRVVSGRRVNPEVADTVRVHYGCPQYSV